MGFFTSKQNLSSDVTSALIYENAKVKPVEIQSLFDKIGAVYDEVENQLIVLTINIEIMRYSLLKSNAKDVLDNVVTSAYQRFYNSLRVNNEQRLEYQEMIDKAKIKVDEILFNTHKQLAPKSTLVYRLIIELEDIPLPIIDRITEQEFILTVDNWFKQAKSVNDTYKIFDTEENKSNSAPIDFDF